jgi:ABC-2 type transport system ATP-binding protein
MGPTAAPDEHRDTATPAAEEATTDSAADPALAIDNLSKQFGDGENAVVAVDDVSLTVDTGSVVGLLGPNGAGKTTLIKCALGIVLPDTGSVRVFGTDVTDSHRAAYADVDAMLEGARNDYWRLTVRENLRYFTTIHGVDPASVADRHDRLLDRLNLTAKADTPVRELSRGMKQKVSLASVLAGGADLVFLDEPTLGLDVESSRTLRRELRRLASEEGVTIILSSHDMSVIEAVCDRVVIMADGRIVADDTVSALLSTVDRNVVRVVSPDIDSALLTTLRSTFEVRAVGSVAGGTRVEIAAVDDAIYELMETLRAADVRITEIQTVQPELEELFVELTGLPSEQEGSQRGSP